LFSDVILKGNERCWHSSLVCCGTLVWVTLRAAKLLSSRLKQPTEGPMSSTILVVDDEPSIALTLASILQRQGYQVFTAPDADSALKSLEQVNPDLVISDVIMPGMNGLEMAITLRSLRPNCPVILMSGNANTQDLLEDARAEGHVYEVLAKPIPPRELLARIASVLPPALP
jgi:CheY-like chemotaxis protein